MLCDDMPCHHHGIVSDDTACHHYDVAALDREGRDQTMTHDNSALWLPKRGARFEVGPAPYTPPAAGEVTVRVRAVAVNPVDTIPGLAYRLIMPWLGFP